MTFAGAEATVPHLETTEAIGTGTFRLEDLVIQHINIRFAFAKITGKIARHA